MIMSTSTPRNGDFYFVSDARARFAHNSLCAQSIADVGGFSEDVPQVEWDWGRLAVYDSS